MKRGPSAITQMRFPDICLVEQTEQKLRRMRVCCEEKRKKETKTSNCNSRSLIF